jgi:MFS family permease
MLTFHLRTQSFFAALGIGKTPLNYPDLHSDQHYSDSTVVATLTGPITSTFKSGQSFSWIASGYLIANAATQPLSGKLTDIYGRRAGLIFAVTFFSIGTLICGVAPTDKIMILGRVVAGAGGGCLNTISVFVASDLIPLRKRGLWQGIGNLVYGAGMGLGTIYVGNC